MRFHRVGIASKVSYEVLDSLESGWLCAAAGNDKWENDTRRGRQVLWHQQLYIYLFIYLKQLIYNNTYIYNNCIYNIYIFKYIDGYKYIYIDTYIYKYQRDTHGYNI